MYKSESAKRRRTWPRRQLEMRIKKRSELLQGHARGKGERRPPGCDADLEPGPLGEANSREAHVSAVQTWGGATERRMPDGDGMGGGRGGVGKERPGRCARLSVRGRYSGLGLETMR